MPLLIEHEIRRRQDLRQPPAHRPWLRRQQQAVKTNSFPSGDCCPEESRGRSAIPPNLFAMAPWNKILLPAPEHCTACSHAKAWRRCNIMWLTRLATAIIIAPAASGFRCDALRDSATLPWAEVAYNWYKSRGRGVYKLSEAAHVVRGFLLPQVMIAGKYGLCCYNRKTQNNDQQNDCGRLYLSVTVYILIWSLWNLFFLWFLAYWFKKITCVLFNVYMQCKYTYMRTHTSEHHW